jgi:hypothetical protein
MKARSIIALVILLAGGLFVSVIALCGGTLYLTFSQMDSSISPVIDELFVAMENDKFAETYDTHTTPELQRVSSREQYAQIGQLIKTRLGKLKSKSMTRFNAQQMNATRTADVVYNGTFEKGTGTITAKLKQVGDKWQLVAFNVNSPEFAKDLATAKCPHCGQPHTADAKFCPKCGKPISPSEEKLKPSAETEKTKGADASNDEN